MIKTIGKWWRELRGGIFLWLISAGCLTFGLWSRKLDENIAFDHVTAAFLIFPLLGLFIGVGYKLRTGQGIGNRYLWSLLAGTTSFIFFVVCVLMAWPDPVLSFLVGASLTVPWFLVGAGESVRKEGATTDTSLDPEETYTKRCYLTSLLLGKMTGGPVNRADGDAFCRFYTRILLWFLAFLVLSGGLGLVLARFPENDYALPLLLAFLLSVGMAALFLVYLARNTRIPGIDDPFDDQDQDRE